MALQGKRRKSLKKTNELIQENPGIILYAMDEAGIKRESTITSCRCLKGKTSIVLSPATHEKIALVGAVKIGSGEILGKEVDNFDRNTMISFLDLLLEHEKDSTDPIYVILDNARPHRAKAVQFYIEEKAQRIHLLFLPPYSPELNPSENIWRQLRKEKTHNALFQTLCLLRSSVFEFFSKYSKPNDTMRSLCALV
jgi:transposase